MNRKLFLFSWNSFNRNSSLLGDRAFRKNVFFAQIFPLLLIFVTTVFIFVLHFQLTYYILLSLVAVLWSVSCLLILLKKFCHYFLWRWTGISTTQEFFIFLIETKFLVIIEVLFLVFVLQTLNFRVILPVKVISVWVETAFKIRGFPQNLRFICLKRAKFMGWV